MGAVAERRSAGVFAVAESDALGFVDFEFHWLKACDFVRTVAVGLVFRLAAAAPPVGAGFEVENGGFFVSDVGSGHGGSVARIARTARSLAVRQWVAVLYHPKSPCQHLPIISRI